MVTRTELVVGEPESRSPVALAFIRERLDGMSNAEGKIAASIFADPTATMFLSITEVAERAGVSDGTVSRFCRRMGLRGFHELKIRLAQELAPREVALFASDDSGHPGPDWARDAARRAMSAIEQTALMIDPEALIRTVELLTGARKVAFYGQGSSGVTALDAAEHFLGIGLQCEAYADAHVQAMSAVLLTSNDVAVAFSRSGCTKDVVSCLSVAKKQGARTISITGIPRSPLTKVSDVVLHVAAEHSIVGTLHSKIVQLFALELMVEGCAEILGPRAQEAANRVRSVVVDKMY